MGGGSKILHYNMDDGVHEEEDDDDDDDDDHIIEPTIIIHHMIICIPSAPNTFSEGVKTPNKQLQIQSGKVFGAVGYED